MGSSSRVKMNHSIIQYNMQAQCNQLEFLFINECTDRTILAKRVKICPQTFRFNMRILDDGGWLTRATEEIYRKQ